ncbi:MAG: hypothetical protein ABSH32_28610 [Bryobacteraceae bacterium]|jgi:hypothetical protein
MLFPIVWFFALPPAQCQEEPFSSGGPAVTLGIEINLPSGGAWPVAAGADHAVLYIPAVGKGEMLGVIRVPEGRFAGVLVRPSMGENSVKIDVSALLKAPKKLSEVTCAEMQSWPSEAAGSYEGKKDESLLLSGLAQLGLPVFKVRVVGVRGPPPGGPKGGPGHPPYAGFRAFCDCSSTRDALNADMGVLAYPEAGKCAKIGECAQCCRILNP